MYLKKIKSLTLRSHLNNLLLISLIITFFMLGNTTLVQAESNNGLNYELSIGNNNKATLNLIFDQDSYVTLSINLNSYLADKSTLIRLPAVTGSVNASSAQSVFTALSSVVNSNVNKACSLIGVNRNQRKRSPASLVACLAAPIDLLQETKNIELVQAKTPQIKNLWQKGKRSVNFLFKWYVIVSIARDLYVQGTSWLYDEDSEDALFIMHLLLANIVSLLDPFVLPEIKLKDLCSFFRTDCERFLPEYMCNPAEACKMHGLPAFVCDRWASIFSEVKEEGDTGADMQSEEEKQMAVQMCEEALISICLINDIPFDMCKNWIVHSKSEDVMDAIEELFGEDSLSFIRDIKVGPSASYPGYLYIPFFDWYGMWSSNEQKTCNCILTVKANEKGLCTSIGQYQKSSCPDCTECKCTYSDLKNNEKAKKEIEDWEKLSRTTWMSILLSHWQSIDAEEARQKIEKFFKSSSPLALNIGEMPNCSEQKGSITPKPLFSIVAAMPCQQSFKPECEPCFPELGESVCIIANQDKKSVFLCCDEEQVCTPDGCKKSPCPPQERCPVKDNLTGVSYKCCGVNEHGAPTSCKTNSDGTGECAVAYKCLEPRFSPEVQNSPENKLKNPFRCDHVEATFFKTNTKIDCCALEACQTHPNCKKGTDEWPNEDYLCWWMQLVAGQYGNATGNRDPICIDQDLGQNAD